MIHLDDIFHSYESTPYPRYIIEASDAGSTFDGWPWYVQIRVRGGVLNLTRMSVIRNGDEFMGYAYSQLNGGPIFEIFND